jgi:hypothetical protein
MFDSYGFIACDAAQTNAEHLVEKHRLKGEKERHFSEVLTGLDLHRPPDDPQNPSPRPMARLVAALATTRLARHRTTRRQHRLSAERSPESTHHEPPKTPPENAPREHTKNADLAWQTAGKADGDAPRESISKPFHNRLSASHQNPVVQNRPAARSLSTLSSS